VLVEVPIETARALQRIAWEAVLDYPRSGVRMPAPRRPATINTRSGVPSG
jgi:hypothetical protein